MADLHHDTGNGTLNIFLALVIASATGAGGFMQGITKDELVLADLALGMILKAVSIVSFFLVIVLSTIKVSTIIKGKFKKDASKD